MGRVGSSPAFRRNGRQNPHPPKPAIEEPILPLEDLTDEQLAQEAIRVLRSQMLAPTRHATAVTSTARAILEYTKAKPAQATTLSGPAGGPIKSEHTIRFVDPAETV